MGPVGIDNLGGKTGLGVLGNEQLQWIEDDLKGRSATGRGRGRGRGRGQAGRRAHCVCGAAYLRAALPPVTPLAVGAG